MVLDSSYMQYNAQGQDVCSAGAEPHQRLCSASCGIVLLPGPCDHDSEHSRSDTRFRAHVVSPKPHGL